MPNDVAKAVRALRAGKPVVFPTDTVYGLGVAVRYADSPQALYAIKQRDAGKPIAWLVGGPDALDEFGTNVSEDAKKLVGEHWPGALTVIVRASDAVPDAFASSAGTIGLRMPACPEALDLIREVGPIATSSANFSGDSAPRSFGDVDEGLLDSVAAFVRSPQLGSGVASTVLDCSQGEIVIVRQGALKIGM